MKKHKLLKYFGIALAIAIPIMLLQEFNYWSGYHDAKNEITTEESSCDVVGVTIAATVTPSYLSEIITDLDTDNKVKGILLDIDVREDNEEIKNIIQNINKPTAAWLKNTSTPATILAEKADYIAPTYDDWNEVLLYFRDNGLIGDNIDTCWY